MLQKKYLIAITLNKVHIVILQVAQVIEEMLMIKILRIHILIQEIKISITINLVLIIKELMNLMNIPIQLQILIMEMIQIDINMVSRINKNKLVMELKTIHIKEKNKASTTMIGKILMMK